MEKELLELYLDGMDIVLLSSHLNLKTREVVRKLSGLLFGLEFPIQNPEAQNYQKTWCWAEDSRLWQMYAVGIHLVEPRGIEPLTSCLQSRRSTN
jgi:hypothetical protein